MKLRVALGETIRKNRKEQNKTLRDVALASTVSLGFLSEVERGHKEMSSELLEQVARALDMPVSELLWLTAYEMMLDEGLVASIPALELIS